MAHIPRVGHVVYALVASGYPPGAAARGVYAQDCSDDTAWLVCPGGISIRCLKGGMLVVPLEDYTEDEQKLSRHIYHPGSMA